MRCRCRPVFRRRIKAISGSTVSVFTEPDDFETALRAEGVVGLPVIEPGPFRARLTQVVLHRLRLCAAEEQRARIAFIAVPADMLLVVLPTEGRGASIWGGISIGRGELLTLGPGERAHVRTAGPGRFGAVRLPVRELVRYGRALSGAKFAIPPALCRWLPPPAAGMQLRELHAAAARRAASRPDAFANDEAVHGLEQQFLHALIDCLPSGSARQEAPTARQHRHVLACFEDLLEAGSAGPIGAICAVLGVSERLLRDCCNVHLGMSPGLYRRRRAMQQVNRALRRADPRSAAVTEIARCMGFCDPGRFAANYRAIYGELPSATLRKISVPWPRST